MSDDQVQIVNLFIQQVNLGFVSSHGSQLILELSVTQAQRISIDFGLLILLGEQFELNREVSESLF